MYQPISLMAAQSIAHERERDLQATLRLRGLAARRAPASIEPEPAGRHHWVHDLLVRVHLAHATPH